MRTSKPVSRNWHMPESGFLPQCRKARLARVDLEREQCVISYSRCRNRSPPQTALVRFWQTVGIVLAQLPVCFVEEKKFHAIHLYLVLDASRDRVLGWGVCSATIRVFGDHRAPRRLERSVSAP